METGALFYEGKMPDAQTKQWIMLEYAYVFRAHVFLSRKAEGILSPSPCNSRATTSMTARGSMA